MRTKKEIQERLDQAREEFKNEKEVLMDNRHTELELQWIVCLEWVLGGNEE